MPARKEEIGHAKEEGIELRLLNNPTRILGNDKGWVNGMEDVYKRQMLLCMRLFMLQVEF